VILWMDPGETTGWATFNVAKQEYRVGEVAPDGVAGLIDRHYKRSLAADGLYPIYGAEDFIGGGLRSKEVIFTLQLLGFIRYYVQHRFGVRVEMQDPQMRKSHLEQARRTTVEGEKGIHAVDALAHLLKYLERRQRG
jgi:hypothetical protein